MYLLCMISGILVGVSFMYIWHSARLKAVQAEAARAQQEALSELTQQNARLAAQHTAAVQAREQLEKSFRELSATTQAQFKALAQDILDEKTKGLESKNAEVLRPLKQDVENFVKKVDLLEKQNTDARARLETHLETMIKSTEKIDQSALSLTNAIKGEAIVRGNWGEETLKRIFDAAGMKEGVDYFQQVADGNIRADVHVALPGDRWIVVDSKTLFNHYADYYNATDPKEKAAALKAHVAEMRKTIQTLSSKKYYKPLQEKSEQVQPDYTLMFVYPESALLTAIEADPDILRDAWKYNIALVSASSLMSTLKMVAKLWDIDKQHEYMEELKEDIVKFVEKFNDFIVNFVKAESATLNAAEAMRIARGHIDGDKGALLPTAQRIADIYEVPLTKTNVGLLKRMGYAYDGTKQKKPAKKLPPPAVAPSGLFPQPEQPEQLQ